MEQMYIISGLITLVFFVAKIIENKMNKSNEEEKPMKNIIKDTIIVFISCSCGMLIYDQFFPALVKDGAANAFIDNPDF
jgi:glucose uptake protein GlcU